MASIQDSRVWFITGTSQGLGKSIVTYVLEQNERVVATLRTPSALADLQDKYSPEQLLVLRVDVAKPSDISDAFKKTEEHFHRLDVVVNNAAYGLTGEIEATPDDAARLQMEVLFWGAANVTKEAIRFFREVNPPGHGGRIFNMSSIGGYTGNPGLAFYSAAKFALEGFTESFVREMPPEWNITGVIVEPGGLQTNGRHSMVVVPKHPAYSKDSPSQAFYEQMMRVPFTGDTRKAAKVIFDVAGVAKPPLRLPMGSIGWSTIVDKAKETLREAGEWKDVSCSTNVDWFSADIKEAM